MFCDKLIKCHIFFYTYIYYFQDRNILENIILRSFLSSKIGDRIILQVAIYMKKYGSMQNHTKKQHKETTDCLIVNSKILNSLSQHIPLLNKMYLPPLIYETITIQRSICEHRLFFINILPFLIHVNEEGNFDVRNAHFPVSIFVFISTLLCHKLQRVL